MLGPPRWAVKPRAPRNACLGPADLLDFSGFSEAFGPEPGDTGWPVPPPTTHGAPRGTPPTAAPEEQPASRNRPRGCHKERPNQMSQAAIKELLEAGVHFGHQARRWNPKMGKYILAKRHG